MKQNTGFCDFIDDIMKIMSIRVIHNSRTGRKEYKYGLQYVDSDSEVPEIDLLEEYIEREATPEEIEELKMKADAKRYNL